MRSNCDSCGRHFNSSPVESFLFIIHQSLLWSVKIMNCDHFRYGLNSRATHRTAINSQRVVSYACSALLKQHHQYFTGFVGSFTGPAIRRTIPAGHKYQCQVCVIHLVSVVPVSGITAIDALVNQAPRPHSRSAFQSTKAGGF